MKDLYRRDMDDATYIYTDVDAIDIEPNIRERRNRRSRKEKRTKEKKSKQTGQEPWFLSWKIHG